MGYYKFRFSDMMPNVWFYKLKDTTKTRNSKKQIPVTKCPSTPKPTTIQTHHFHPRKSYYFTRELIIDPRFKNPPRKSSKQQQPRKMNPGKSLHESLSELKLKLPPIKTKVKEENLIVVKEKKKKNINGSNVRKLSVNSPGVRLRVNSPRIRIQTAVYGRKNFLSGSFAVVKSSFDPQSDFMESMMEMIKENNIRGSKDLEDLLACYLTLNSDEYHDVIIKVFKQIWFGLSHVLMK